MPRLVKNAARFGFVNYVFEPWHWEWVGDPAPETRMITAMAVKKAPAATHAVQASMTSDRGAKPLLLLLSLRLRALFGSAND